MFARLTYLRLAIGRRAQYRGHPAMARNRVKRKQKRRKKRHETSARTDNLESGW
jgi:hypothetical protein